MFQFVLYIRAGDQNGNKPGTDMIPLWAGYIVTVHKEYKSKVRNVIRNSRNCWGYFKTTFSYVFHQKNKRTFNSIRQLRIIQCRKRQISREKYLITWLNQKKNNLGLWFSSWFVCSFNHVLESLEQVSSALSNASVDLLLMVRLCCLWIW